MRPSAAAGALRAMLLFALSGSSHSLFGDSVHTMRSVFSGYQGGAAIFRSVSPRSEGGPSSQLAQSPPAGSEAMDHEKPRRSPLYDRRCDRPPPPLWLHGCLLLLSRPDPWAPGVAQRLVDLSAHPQTVQKHRKLPRHGHRRPLLGVLAPAGGYLLPVTS